MILKCLLVSLFLSASVCAASSQSLVEVKAQFEALHAKQDRTGCLELWKANAAAVLPVIDADLEGGLKVFESQSPDAAQIKALHQRAVWGAQAAAEATGHPILIEYASAFVGWDDAQKKSFRAGQKAFGDAMKALEKNDAQAALESARACTTRALPLGDWWGAAMGFAAQGHAHAALGAHEEALAAFAQARLVYHDLGLARDGYECARGIVEACSALGRAARGREAANHALAFARSQGDQDGVGALLEARAGFEEQLGDQAAAAATRAEAKIPKK